MAARGLYQVVDLGSRAMLVRSRIGGGFSKVADCRTLSGAQRLVDELNGVNSVHADVIREALRLLRNKSVAQAAELLQLSVGPVGDEDASDD